jgi:UDP-N-acetylglucosamine 2-epimerase (non-hydrolysing)
VKIVHVVGARPNFMKIAPVLAEIQRHNEQDADPKFESLLVHTGQHYDQAMSQSFFEDLGLPRPDLNLEIGSGSHAEQTGKIMIAFEKIIERKRPEMVLVVGDINSTLACALAAKKMNIPVAHVEAGLRSGDMTMPEEINRKLTDAVADLLFTTDLGANANLKREGIPDHRIFFVGNVMIDTLLKHRERASCSPILETLGLKEERQVKPYGVFTLHRPSNVDHFDALQEILEAVKILSDVLPIIFPCHPRTVSQIEAFGLQSYFGTSIQNGDRLVLVPPFGYLDFLQLHAHAKIILTDSGGIQEEATILGVPCLTLRENTERPITIVQGTNRLVGTRRDSILKGFESAMEERGGLGRIPEKWDGRAAERVVAVLAETGRLTRSGGSRHIETLSR